MVYIHIPFCGSFCTYCGFYSEITVGDCFSGYGAALREEILSRRDELSGEPHTIYVGGGTPSLMPPDALAPAVWAVRTACGSRADTAPVEFTMEVNPEDIVSKGKAYLSNLLGLGVNRVSMGVQSFDDGMLGWMKRRHSSATAVKAYGMLQDAGFRNISIDLIFGISHMDDGMWLKTLDMALDLAPQHISAYQLSVEPGSALAAMADSGKYSEAPGEQCRRQYDILCRRLSDAGYHHYEISNFALPGFEAVHNSAYWGHVPYAGFGPGAHSLRVKEGSLPEGLPACTRSWNIPDVREYLRCYSSQGPSRSSVSQSETLSAGQVALERIMLGLRTDRGVERGFLERHADRARLAAMLSEGLLVPAQDPLYVRIPEDSFFISDSIIADIV